MAQLFAEAVSVLCPSCGEPQPNPEGSEMWMREDLRKKHGEFGCVSCDARILIEFTTKVQFQ